MHSMIFLILEIHLHSLFQIKNWFNLNLVLYSIVKISLEEKKITMQHLHAINRIKAYGLFSQNIYNDIKCLWIYRILNTVILVSVHGSLILYQALYDITQFILCSYLQIWLYVPWSTVSRHRGPLGVLQHFSSCPHSPSLTQRGALFSSSGSISWTLSEDGHLSLRLAVNVG